MIIGWREHVGLPAWGVSAIMAKIDTGARTSAIHVDNIRELPGGRVTFDVIMSRKIPQRCVPVTAWISRVTYVRTSIGLKQRRYVVSTEVQIGPLLKEIELSLVCRKHMICRMLLGRSALGDEFLVDVSRRYLFNNSAAPRLKRKSSP